MSYEKNNKMSIEKQFIKKLENATIGDLAILKRSSGRNLEESRNALGVFYKLLPYQVHYPQDEEIYFLIATLYSLNKYKFTGNFGLTMRIVKQKFDSESLNKRITSLLGSNFNLVGGSYQNGGELAYKIRQCTKLATSKEVGVDWVHLLMDLKFWTHPKKFVQKKWARSYFSTKKVTNIIQKKDKNKLKEKSN